MSRKQVQRSGRTLQTTISALFESPRFKMAIAMYEKDDMLLRALITEVGLETMNVVRSKLTKVYAQHSSLAAFEMIPLLRSTNDFNTFGLFFPMDEIEKSLYQADPKFKLSPDERFELLEKLRVKFMEAPASKPRTSV